MVGGALVSVVETPNVSDVGNFVVAASEELLEVFCGLNQLGQPDQVRASKIPTTKSQSR
jgi:hypothetical protein